MYSGIYEDIAVRTGGDIYVGVVGPVRTGKSSFIKKFMELLVIPNIENKYKKDRAVDELPQSGSGRSIMTCEPKFVPNEAVEINLLGNAPFNVRLIDCVGYMVKNALGAFEGDTPRMVQTPWSKDALPFEEAAEIGTRKVIEEHSTIGIVVVTDGSIADIQRSDYVAAEERVIGELKKLNKPFIIVLNTMAPLSKPAVELQKELEEKYSIPVITLDVIKMTMEDITSIFAKILYEFPVGDVIYQIPKWISNLSEGHWLSTQIEDYVMTASTENDKLRSVIECASNNVCENFEIKVESIDLSKGSINCKALIGNEVFYKIIGDENNVELNNESDLFFLLTRLLRDKNMVDSFINAKNDAERMGYGIVVPDFAKLTLNTPEMFNDSGKYGISFRAEAQALHMIQTDITSEISPVIGSESECELFYDKLIDLYDNAPQELWKMEIFGRKLMDMLTDNIKLKLNGINEDTKQKMVKVVNRISNAQKGGLLIFWI